MEAQLKALKVPELKSILQKANLAVSGKKDDLIARILASPAATASLSQETVPKAAAPAPAPSTSQAAPAPIDDDLLAPPAAFDWNASATEPTTTSAVPAAAKPDSKATTTIPASTSTSSTLNASAPAFEPSTKPASTAATTQAEDAEIAKMKARAARFGIEYVEPKKAPPPKAAATKADPKAKPGKEKVVADPTDTDAKKKTRAERFGTGAKEPASKAAAPAKVLDPVEEEKKRKRAERFGLTTAEPDSKKTKTS